MSKQEILAISLFPEAKRSTLIRIFLLNYGGIIIVVVKSFSILAIPGFVIYKILNYFLFRFIYHLGESRWVKVEAVIFKVLELRVSYKHLSL
jgi:hypothetical protein